MKEFYQLFFSVNLKDYVNLGWDLEINKVLLAVALIMCAMVFVVHLRRRAIYLAVKQLVRHEAKCESDAKTLRELGLDGNTVLKALLRSESSSVKLIRRAGAVEYTYEEYIALEKAKKLPKQTFDVSTAAFYLSEEDDARIKRILDSYNSSLTKTVLGAVFTLVCYICIMLLMPELLTLIDNIIGWVKGLY